MKKTLLKAIAMALLLTVMVPAGAQDERRVNEILKYAEVRAKAEADAAFGLGEFPKAIHNQRMRIDIRPWDENLATDLIWMLGNIELDGEALVVAMQFREQNPADPDRGYPEAALYIEWKMYSRIPSVLEPDVLMVPPPHRNSYSALSAAYTRMGLYADVVRVLGIALKHYPDDAVFKRNRDRAAQQIGR